MGLYADGGITFTKVASVNASSPAVLQEGIHPVRDSAFIWEHSPALPGGLARYTTSHWFSLRYLLKDSKAT